MKHLSSFPCIMSRMACSLTYQCISLLDISLWFWMFNVTSILSFFFFPNKDVLARPSILGAPLRCLKSEEEGVQKPSPVQLPMRTLAPLRGQHHSPQEGKGSAPRTGSPLFPPH